MSLKNQIGQRLKEAMKAKDQAALRALRAIKSMILLAETAEGSNGTLSEADEMKLLAKAAKQRKDSLALYQEQGRDDLAQTEQEELTIIESFLPKKMTADELSAAVKEIITQVGAQSPKDMGKVMGVASKQLAGKADGKDVAQTVKTLLAQM